MVFFTISIVSRIERKDFILFYFDRTLAAFSVFGEYAKIFQQLLRTPEGQYFNHGRRDIISEPQENTMQLKLFVCPTGKYHSAYSPYALNEIYLALTQQI